MDITPIVDLCHFGVPDWLGNFQNPEFPEAFAEYAGAFAARFPHLKLYTPVNEIFIAARFSAELGWWNERPKSERAFVTALKHLVRAKPEGLDQQRHGCCDISLRLYASATCARQHLRCSRYR